MKLDEVVGQLNALRVNMKTSFVISGDKYVVPGSYLEVFNQLDDAEESWVEMLINQDEFEYVEHTSEEVTHTIDELVLQIQIGTTSAMMDGWDPEEDDEEEIS